VTYVNTHLTIVTSAAVESTVKIVETPVGQDPIVRYLGRDRTGNAPDDEKCKRPKRGVTGYDFTYPFYEGSKITIYVNSGVCGVTTYESYDETSPDSYMQLQFQGHI